MPNDNRSKTPLIKNLLKLINLNHLKYLQLLH